MKKKPIIKTTRVTIVLPQVEIKMSPKTFNRFETKSHRLNISVGLARKLNLFPLYLFLDAKKSSFLKYKGEHKNVRPSY